MSVMTIKNLHEFLEEKGLLHDVRVNELILAFSDACIQLTVRDINANTFNLPEYPGEEPAIIRFNQVSDCVSRIDSNERFLWIFEAEAEQVETTPGNREKVVIKFVPQGHLSFTCSGATIGRPS